MFRMIFHLIAILLGGLLVGAIAPPAGAGRVRVRAVQVDPAVVLSITPQDVNIVVDRFAPRPVNADVAATDDRFDLIVATNIFVYYDAFDQALALVNVSQMLRPGGYLLTNYQLAPIGALESLPALTTTVEFDRQHNGDSLFWYRRR